MRRLDARLLLASSLVLAASARSTEARPVPHMDHVIVVIMENKDYNTALTGTYTQSLVAHESSCANSFALTHPSQPNYIALWAGSTLNVTNDNCPPFGSPYSAENLGHACEAAGLTWRAYSENLPSVGYTGCTFNNSLYTRKHDPWVSFTNVNHANERPYGDLQSDINAQTLPNLAFVVPNNCDNSHNTGCTVQFADGWLAANLPIMRSAVGPRGLVILTWDEDNGQAGNHILTVFAADSAKSGYVSGTHVTHYTVLRTICDALGLTSFGGALAENPLTDIWLDPRTILASAGPNGSISPSGAVAVLPGADKAFSITPELHYHVADVLVDGLSVGPVTDYTFTNVTTDHTIEASFAIDTHTLGVDVHGSGTVAREPSLDRYDYGSSVELTATPAPGWVFMGWGGDAGGSGATVTLLMDGDKNVTATFALEIAFDFKPHDLHLDSKDKWVTGFLRPPAPFLASQVDVSSIRLNGTVPVSDEYPPKIEDHDSKLKVKFMRALVKPTLTPGDAVPVTVTGTISGEALIGVDVIKVKAPKIHAPHAGDQLIAGATVPVIWDAPEGATSVTLLSSLDDGVTWNVEADAIPNSGTYSWTVPAASTAAARLEIMAVYGVDETGVIPESEFATTDAFSIQTLAGVESGRAVFALQPRNPVTGPLTVSFSLTGKSAASLAVYDVSGRVVVSRAVTNGPGWHTMTLGALPPGIFLVRLNEGERHLSYRVAVMR